MLNFTNSGLQFQNQAAGSGATANTPGTILSKTLPTPGSAGSFDRGGLMRPMTSFSSGWTTMGNTVASPARGFSLSPQQQQQQAYDSSSEGGTMYMPSKLNFGRKDGSNTPRYMQFPGSKAGGRSFNININNYGSMTINQGSAQDNGGYGYGDISQEPPSAKDNSGYGGSDCEPTPTPPAKDNYGYMDCPPPKAPDKPVVPPPKDQESCECPPEPPKKPTPSKDQGGYGYMDCPLPPAKDETKPPPPPVKDCPPPKAEDKPKPPSKDQGGGYGNPPKMEDKPTPPPKGKDPYECPPDMEPQKPSKDQGGGYGNPPKMEDKPTPPPKGKDPYECPPDMEPQKPSKDQGGGYGNPPKMEDKPKPPPVKDCPPPKTEDKPPPPKYEGGDKGSYWGDPHLVGFDGEKYDVMGKGGNFYNMISDKGFQYNTQFKSFENYQAGGTVIGQAGFQVGKSKVILNADTGKPTVDGKDLEVNKEVSLDENGTALWDGNKLNVKSKEYNVNLLIKTDQGTKYLDSDVSLNGSPFEDYVKPHGLLGQTADGIAGEKNSGVDQGKQGGTVIDGTVDDYKVSNLFDNNFKYNRFS